MKKCTAVLLLLLLAYALPACAASVVLPESAGSIGARAFMNDVSITEIRIPESVTQIGEEAFGDNVSLQTIVINQVANMFGIGTQEILVIALIILLLFGGKKIPELMKGLGKGVKSFKEGMNDLDDLNKKKDDKEKDLTE